MAKKVIEKTIGDAVCRVHRTVSYTLLSNCFVRSTNLQCPAIGLLGKVMGLPSTWNFTITGLEKICGNGETAIRTALKELESFGYVTRTVQMPDASPTGRIRYIYDFYEYSEKDDSLPKYDVVMETFTAENATLNRVKKDSNYTSISNKLLQNREIKLKLLGFLLKVLSLPNNWRFSMSGLTAICKEGKTAVRSAVSKLIEMGYLVRTRLLPNESIHHTFEYVYEFFEHPLNQQDAAEKSAETRRKARSVCMEDAVDKSVNTKKKTSPEVKNQTIENLSVDTPVSESPVTENRGQYNNDNPKKKNKTTNYHASIIPSSADSKVFNTETADEGMKEGYLQEISVYTDTVKANISYLRLGEWLYDDYNDGYDVADEIVGYIVNEICSPAAFGKIRGQLVPREIIRSAMLKADITAVQNALLQMAKVDDVKNFPPYFISTLFGEVNQRHFKDNCEHRWAYHAVKRDFGYAPA